MSPLPSTQSYILRSARRDGVCARLIAAVALVGAVALCAALDSYLGDSAAFVTLFGAVTIAVWMFGSRVAVAFALAGYLGCHFLFVEPRYEFSFGDPRTLAGIVAYALTCGLIVAIGEAMRSAQDRAHARGELLRVTLAGISDAVIATDIESRITYLNESAEVLTGWSCMEAMGHPLNTVFRLIDSSGSSAVTEAMQAPRGQRPAERAHTAVLLGRDAVSRLVEHSAAPIKDSGGLIAGCVVTFRDISERQLFERADAERVHAAANLCEADRRKNVFLATLAHELRNPLAPLCNALEIARRAGDRRRMTTTAIETIQRQTAQIVRLVDDLLDLSRISHDKLELRRDVTELGAVIRQAVESCWPIAEAAGHDVRIVLPPEPVHMHADSARLVQALANLINNSCKYTRAGGKITVAAERDGDWATVTVEDNGIGIPRDKLDSIFDMFVQVDTSLEREQGGLGIGLTLVSKLVAMHGGTVKAESAGEGQGSSFVMRLPVEPGSARGEAPLAASAPAIKRSRRVLVVDDNHACAVSLVRLLKLDGHATFIARDGSEALEAAERDRPDVVILDIGMPVLNGYEACRRLRARPNGKDLLIIALTGGGQDSDRRKSQEAGFDAHFVKPADYSALAAILGSGVARDSDDGDRR